MERSPRASAAERTRPVADPSPGVATPAPESASEVAAQIERFAHAVASRECERALRCLEDPTPAQRAAVETLANALATRLLGSATATVENTDDVALVADAGRLFDAPTPGHTDD